MGNAVPKRIASVILNSLKGGVVPRTGLEYIAVGRTKEIEALLHDAQIIEDGGAVFRFIVGRYGSGKSFLLQIIRNYMLERGFAVADADLSPERRFSGSKGQGLATYKELIQNLSVKAKPDGGALSLILEKWLSAVQSETAAKTGLDPESELFDAEVTRKIYSVINSLEGMVNGFDFARAVLIYWQAYKDGDEIKKSFVLKWFRGEYASRAETRRDLGINLMVSDDTWYEFIKIFAVFLVKAGYKGLLVIVDELVNIFKIPYSVTRQYNYEKILMMYNDTMQGKAKHLGIFMGGTPQFIEDPHKGVYSYEALRSRLTQGKFASPQVHDLLAPIISLNPLSYEEMYVLTEKLADIHAGLYEYENTVSHDDIVNFLKLEYGRIGAGISITPREIIRDFIELLNIASQNENVSIAGILSKDFLDSVSLPADEEADEEFAEFEV